MHRLMEMLSKANVNYSETNFDDKRDLEQLVHPYVSDTYPISIDCYLWENECFHNNFYYLQDSQSRIYVFAMDSLSSRYLFCEVYAYLFSEVYAIIICVYTDKGPQSGNEVPQVHVSELWHI